MNKAELIEAMTEAADITKVEAGRALDGLVDAITDALKKGDTVSLVGFGSFLVKERAERQGRNPQSGESITIAAARIPSFKAGKALKDAVK
jgi:DNA-binding protein HU-beta